jgi:predicted nucleic acid-binding Zn ribbon protein
MNDHKRHDPERRGSPLPLERVLEGVLRECGLEDRLAQRRALDAWDVVVGREIAAHSRAIDLEQGVLTLQADHGAWRQELTLLMPQIMTRFNSRFGPGTVTSIQWARASTDRRSRDNQDGHIQD